MTGVNTVCFIYNLHLLGGLPEMTSCPPFATPTPPHPTPTPSSSPSAAHINCVRCRPICVLWGSEWRRRHFKVPQDCFTSHGCKQGGTSERCSASTEGTESWKDGFYFNKVNLSESWHFFYNNKSDPPDVRGVCARVCVHPHQMSSRGTNI